MTLKGGSDRQRRVPLMSPLEAFNVEARAVFPRSTAGSAGSHRWPRGLGIRHARLPVGQGRGGDDGAGAMVRLSVAVVVNREPASVTLKVNGAAVARQGFR